MKRSWQKLLLHKSKTEGPNYNIVSRVPILHTGIRCLSWVWSPVSQRFPGVCPSTARCDPENQVHNIFKSEAETLIASIASCPQVHSWRSTQWGLYEPTNTHNPQVSFAAKMCKNTTDTASYWPHMQTPWPQQWREGWVRVGRNTGKKRGINLLKNSWSILRIIRWKINLGELNNCIYFVIRLNVRVI